MIIYPYCFFLLMVIIPLSFKRATWRTTHSYACSRVTWPSLSIQITGTPFAPSPYPHRSLNLYPYSELCLIQPSQRKSSPQETPLDSMLPAFAILSLVGLRHLSFLALIWRSMHTFGRSLIFMIVLSRRISLNAPLLLTVPYLWRIRRHTIYLYSLNPFYQ